MQEIIDQLDALEKELNDALKFLDMPQLEERLKVLEADMQKPNFWDKQMEAQKVAKEHGALSQKVNAWKKFGEDLTYARELTQVINVVEDEEELKELRQTVSTLEKRYEKMEIQLYLSGPYDSNPAMISVHAGAGGTDAQDWAEMLLRMYTRYAEAKDWKVTLLEKSDGEEAGIKSATVRIEGEFTYGFLKEEAGVHRLVRLSPFNSKHTRETSFCLVEVIPEIDETDLEIQDDDLRIDVFRAGGHGGQSVNTTDSAVRITHVPTGLVAKCQNERSQLQNRQQAMKVLKSKLIVLQEKMRKKEISEIKGEYVEGSWGNQIRSYVLHPYQMVKDHRTEYETSQVEAMLNGDPNQMDVFIEKSLRSGQKELAG